MIAAHFVGPRVAWPDSRLVPLGSMAAGQAVNDLASGVRDHAMDALSAFLATYKRASGGTLDGVIRSPEINTSSTGGPDPI